MMLSAKINRGGTTCSKVFSKNLYQRQSYPLRSGLYKLKEALYFIEALEKEIQLLSRLHRMGEPLRGLRTYGDHANWIKNIPKFIAEEFGWKVLPAIRALEADGVNELKLQKFLPSIESRIKNLISECDFVFEEMQSPISNEYSRWKIGRSALEDLFYLAITIIESSINLTACTRSMGLTQIAANETEQGPY